jgi:hypothetical protein
MPRRGKIVNDRVDNAFIELSLRFNRSGEVKIC